MMDAKTHAAGDITEAPAFWNHRLAPAMPWSSAYRHVEVAAIALLGINPLYRGKTLSTNELVEALYPAAQARGPESIAARSRIYKALAALAPRGLERYCFRGTPRKLKGREIVPWLWKAPIRDDAPRCPHCGEII